jgi:hypothetical protein
MLSRLYALVGLVWGLVLGAMAAWWAFAAAAGLSWLYLFGDDPWPAAVTWVLPAIAIVVGTGVLIVSVGLGYAYGRAQRRFGRVSHRTARDRALGLLVLGVLAGGALVWNVAASSHRQSEHRESARDAATWHGELLAARHVVTGIDVETAGDTVRFTIKTDGAHGGDYVLRWAVRDKAYKKILAEGGGQYALTPGEGLLPLRVLSRRLRETYYREVLHGSNAGVLVDEDLQLDVTLEPALSGAELARLSPAERQNLDLGYSDLPSTLAVDFPVRFEYPPGAAAGLGDGSPGDQ